MINGIFNSLLFLLLQIFYWEKVDINFSRSKIEQLDKDITHVLRKAIKHAEWATIGIGKSPEKRKLRASIAFWKAITLEKDGTNVSEGKMQKRSDMSEIRWNKDIAKSEAKEKLREANAS